MKDKEIVKEFKNFLDNIEFIPKEKVEKLDFYEACLYLEKLNALDNITSGDGVKNDWFTCY